MKKHILAHSAKYFLVTVTLLTVWYLVKNKELLTPLYWQVLVLTSLANILCFFSIVYDTRVIFSKVFFEKILLISMTMLLFDGIKASITETVLPSLSIPSFPFYPAMNEQWTWLNKFYWHAILDGVVLYTTIALKHISLWYIIKTSHV